MSSIIRLKGVHFNNASLPVVDVSKHPAQIGLVGEYDMISFNPDGVTLQDLTGNGHNAVFNSAPVRDTNFVTFNGNYHADTGIMLAQNLSGFAVVRKTDINQSSVGFIMSNWGDFKGSLLWPMGNPTGSPADPWNWGLQIGVSDAQYKSEADTVVDDRWELIYFYTGTGGASNLKNLSRNVVGATPVASGQVGIYSWAIGGGRDTNASGTFRSDFNYRDGDIAYCGLYNKILTATEEAYLKDYITAKMLTRGISV